ncbi:conserved exported hypothetical protein [Candidatus Terasakiella magnetica]|nr:conserved exported hypothetical protein [Candidatus Terasakiella magnetica]
MMAIMILRRLTRLALLLPLLALAACGGGRPGRGPDSGLSSWPPDGPPGDDQLAMTAPLRPGMLSPEALKGLSAVQVERALGDPSFRRRDPPAEIWQYRVKACTLDLFLYDENSSRKVSHVAVRTPGGNTITAQDCLDEIIARRNGPPTS